MYEQIFSPTFGWTSYFEKAKLQRCNIGEGEWAKEQKDKGQGWDESKSCERLLCLFQ